MSNPSTVDANAFFNTVEADPQFFQGPGGGGGGGGWGAPQVYNILANFTHTVWTDGNGNQKHTVADNNNNCIQAAAVAYIVNGTVVTQKTRCAGELTSNSSYDLDLSQAPQNGPWKFNVGTAQLVGHQNNVSNATGVDQNNNPWQVTFAYGGSTTASATATCADGGSATWQLPLQGGGPEQMQLDIWAIILLILAAIAGALLAGEFIALFLLAMFFLALIFGLYWVLAHF